MKGSAFLCISPPLKTNPGIEEEHAMKPAVIHTHCRLLPGVGHLDKTLKYKTVQNQKTWFWTVLYLRQFKTDKYKTVSIFKQGQQEGLMSLMSHSWQKSKLLNKLPDESQVFFCFCLNGFHKVPSTPSFLQNSAGDTVLSVWADQTTEWPGWVLFFTLLTEGQGEFFIYSSPAACLQPFPWSTRIHKWPYN